MHARTIARTLIAVTLAVLLPAPIAAQRSPTAPEAATPLQAKPPALAKRQMIAAANPLAVEAGLEILAAGGSATDAAIAVQLVLNLVEPQSSGLGGGAFLLHYDPANRRVQTYDGRETAPAAARPDRFLKPDGTPRGFIEAVFGGQSVGTPGLAAMLELAHKRHGRLAWARLFEPAIRLADAGFPVSPRLHALLKETGAQGFAPEARRHFFDARGEPHPPGHMLKSPAFAATLRTLADKGAAALYSGGIAEAIVKAVREAPNHQGDLTLEDLAAYRAVERPAVCVTYRRHRICGMGAPSSGGITVAMVLKMLEPFDLGTVPMNPRAVHLIAEAEKLAYADRDRFIADPSVPGAPSLAGLLDPGYLARRRALIDPEKARPKAEPGQPPGIDARRAGLDATIEAAGTSHVSVVDRTGAAVSLTTTIENGFGSRLMAAGFLLNNELTDFSFRPVDAAGVSILNAVGPGRRPRSSMAPTIVLDENGRVKGVVGSPGGSRIILYVVKAIVALVDWKVDPQTAADLANFGSRNGPFELETAMSGPMPGLYMTARGHSVVSPEMTSGLHIIWRRRDGRLEGGADPRREGLAKGD